MCCCLLVQSVKMYWVNIYRWQCHKQTAIAGRISTTDKLQSRVPSSAECPRLTSPSSDIYVKPVASVTYVTLCGRQVDTVTRDDDIHTSRADMQAQRQGEEEQLTAICCNKTSIPSSSPSNWRTSEETCHAHRYTRLKVIATKVHINMDK